MEICEDIGWEHDRTSNIHSAKFGGPMGRWCHVWAVKRGQWFVQPAGSLFSAHRSGPYPTCEAAKAAASGVMEKIG